MPPLPSPPPPGRPEVPDRVEDLLLPAQVVQGQHQHGAGVQFDRGGGGRRKHEARRHARGPPRVAAIRAGGEKGGGLSVRRWARTEWRRGSTHEEGRPRSATTHGGGGGRCRRVGAATSTSAAPGQNQSARHSLQRARQVDATAVPLCHRVVVPVSTGGPVRAMDILRARLDVCGCGQRDRAPARLPRAPGACLVHGVDPQAKPLTAHDLHVWQRLAVPRVQPVVHKVGRDRRSTRHDHAAVGQFVRACCPMGGCGRQMTSTPPPPPHTHTHSLRVHKHGLEAQRQRDQHPQVPAPTVPRGHASRAQPIPPPPPPPPPTTTPLTWRSRCRTGECPTATARRVRPPSCPRLGPRRIPGCPCPPARCTCCCPRQR
jgi:hypothetical protein